MYVRPRPERRPAHRSNRRWLACGCLGFLAVVGVLGLVLAVFLLPNLPDIIAGLAGFTARGRTEDVFPVVTPAPAVQLQNPVQPEQLTLNLGQYGGSQVVSGDSEYYDVAVGSDPAGRQTAVVTFTEAGLNQLCYQHSPVCSGADPRYRNVSIDLRPGGAIIFADVTIPTQFGNLEDRIGVVLRLDSTRTRFEFEGMDWRGRLYDSPPPEYRETIEEFERTSNDLLDQLTVDAGAGLMSLAEVRVDDTTLTVVLQ